MLEWFKSLQFRRAQRGTINDMVLSTSDAEVLQHMDIYVRRALRKQGFVPKTI